LSREFAEKPTAVPGLFLCQSLGAEPKSKKFPVLSLFIREFDAETGSRKTASSARQSAIFVFSPENSKTAHAFAHILLAMAPERLRFGLQQPDSAQFSLARTETVPFDHRLAGAFARTSPFIELCQFQ
jgi:hypothetical protein